LATLVAGVRSRAGTARLVALNVPNIAALPLFSGSSLAQRQAAQRASAGMAAAVNSFRGQNVTIVDVMCDSRSYLPSNYSSDGFHPNDAGYAYIASEIVRALTASADLAPQASCPFMSVVPPM
jgi:lysophospholipase L1-like esterase